MPYVAPAAVTSGAVISKTTFGDVVIADLNFLANPPACRVFHNTTQSYTDAVEASQAFNSERFDTNSMHDTVTNNTRITFNTAGLYIVGFTGTFDAGADYANAYAFLRLNGTTYIEIGTEGRSVVGIAAQTVAFKTLYKFAVADYVEVRALQNNTAGAARNMTSGSNFSPEFYAVWVGLG